jgi:hypothetical protein
MKERLSLFMLLVPIAGAGCAARMEFSERSDQPYLSSRSTNSEEKLTMGSQPHRSSRPPAPEVEPVIHNGVR